MNKLILAAAALGFAVAFTACDDDPKTDGNREKDPITGANIDGLYLLNEGGWGQNNSRLDRLEFETGAYGEDLYTAANPEVVMSLGDVGNDLKINAGRLYAVMNGSHKVEVMDASTVKRLGQVNVSSPRAIAFSDGFAYVSSWVDGIVEIDLATLRITRTVEVGQTPEGVAVSGDKLYVACAGDVMNYQYSDELWVLSLPDLTVSEKIKVAPNLHRVIADSDGSIWVNSRGNYADVASGLYRISGSEVKSLGVPCSGFALGKDKIYYYASEWNNATMSSEMTYGTIDRATLAPGAPFITDGTESDVVAPYGVFCCGDNVFLTDAKNYASSGALYVYDSAGKRQQTYTTGVCPSSVVFF